MHIAITGGAGVLGRNLVQRLVEEGHRVTSLDLSLAPEYTNYKQIIGDIRDADVVRSAISGADMVVHAAAALPSYKPQQIRSISVEGTRTVMAACHAARIERVVHVSSSAVYGLPDIVPTTEDYPRERVDPYNCAKIDAELICEDYRAKGMCVPILRPKTFLGPHRLGIFSMLFEWAEEGHHFPLIGGGHFRSQMLDVDDLVDVVSTVIRLPDALVNSEFNVAASEFTTLRDDFQAVLDAAGHGRRVISLPARPAIGVLRALEMLGVSPVYKRLIYKLSRDAFVSTNRAETILGFAPQHSNQDTIIRTFRWWQNQKSSERAVVKAGRTSREPWKQGVLGLAKAVF
ncbi:NAD-dependent epimerase/dehydratase family protein [Krasilnikovia sp. MM14-A1259]|uniref:NAD-dependent epimerase/dehydratase family protein n=1 Tax=Krasilnikovia sp. MM14-A1259 TaxID=3373539 RepID=UPI0037FB02C6